MNNAPQTPSPEAVQKAWHGWAAFTRLTAISGAITACVVAGIVALLAY